MSESHHKKHKKSTSVYNKKDLHIDHRNTIIIIDWDDTLYPTSWTLENNIDLTNPKSRYKYIKYFEKLDDNLSGMLRVMKTLGDVVIITNAMSEWVELSLSVLPKTKKIMRKMEVISARARYQNIAKMQEWKKYTFLEEIIKRSKSKMYTNILSLGDAEFEYNALINLYDAKVLPHKYLKAIKFIKTADYNIIVEQIRMIKSNISEICSMTRHMDLTFDTK
jgi:hypothetical protein